ncbi:hypothetical protein BsWGS_13620 [Bradybaena similaris]
MFSGLVFTLWMATLELIADCTIIDLTHPLAPDSIVWPGFPRFNRTTVLAQVNDQNVWVEAGAFSTGEHGGTHIDAPRHFNRQGFDLNDLPIDLTIADGVMIDVKGEAVTNHDYVLSIAKIQEWEKQHGAIPTAGAVIVNSGWSTRWPDPHQFFNTNATTNQSTFHYPTISKEAAQWLVTNRNLKMLGLDVTGPDSPRDSAMPVHVLLLSRNIVIMENLLIPDTLPARGFRVHAAPIKIVGGTGVQTRIYAMLYKGNSSEKLQCHVVYLLVLWLCLHICRRYLHR